MPDAQALPALAVQHQHVGGDQQHLEEHEQVEQVAGDEGAVRPISWNWNSAWKWRPCASQPPLAYISTGSATQAVSSSISADRRSTTSTMPNGAGQSPSR